MEIDDARTVGWDFGPDLEWHVQAMWPEGEIQGGPAVLVIQPSADYEGAPTPAGGLSHTLLRDIDFAYGRALLREKLELSKWRAGRIHNEQEIETALRAHAEGQRVTDAYLALLARVYVRMSNEGTEKPNDALAEMVQKTPAAIKNHLWQATRKKFLERSAGRAGGRMTPAGAAEVGKALGHDAEQTPRLT